MATLAARITLLAQRIAAEFKARPRGVGFASAKGTIPAGSEWIAPPSPFAYTATVTGSAWRAAVAPAGAVTGTIRKNGSAVGTISLAAGQTVFTTSINTGGGVVAVNDVVSILWPATADTTLAGVSGRWGE